MPTNQDTSVSLEDVEYDIAESLPKNIVFDPRVQREKTDKGKLNRMIADFDPNALGELTFSMRKDGKAVIIDGEHRRLTIEAVSYTGPVTCKLLYGLSLAQEAALFRMLNDNTKVPALDLFKSSLHEGNAENLALSVLFDELKVPLHTSAFRSIAMAQRIARRQSGIAALKWALELTQEVFVGEPSTSPIYHGAIVEAFTMIFFKYGTIIDRPALVSKLRGEAGGVSGLLGRGRTIQQAKKGRLPEGVAAAVMSTYNVKLSVNKLKWD